MKNFFLIILCFLLTLLPSCGASKSVRSSFFLMDTIVDFSVAADDADRLIGECEAMSQELEALLSAHLPGSDVTAFAGSDGGCALDERTAGIVELALRVTDATDGAFDVTVAPLVSLWDISHADENWTPPTGASVNALLPLVGGRAIALNGTTLLKSDPRVSIDLGGIGKGYALGASAEYLASNGASGTVSFGGNIAVVGEKSDGSRWNIGVKDPFDPQTLIGTIKIDRGIVAVSGGYERYAVFDGKTYCHILDPATGYPAETDLASALVWVKDVSPSDGALCDALSTALYVMGRERAEAFYERGAFEFEMLLVGSDGSIFCTDEMEFEKTDR